MTRIIEKFISLVKENKVAYNILLIIGGLFGIAIILFLIIVIALLAVLLAIGIFKLFFYMMFLLMQSTFGKEVMLITM